MILVQAESMNVFRMYFNPRLFKLLQPNSARDIRGHSNTLLIRFGRWWRANKYPEQDAEMMEYCYNHNISVIEIKEPSGVEEK